MTRQEKLIRNRKISNFVYDNYKPSRYQSWTGRTYKYFSNYYQTCTTIKFALFQNYNSIDTSKLEKFLKKEGIQYKEVKKLHSYNYNSLIIRFEL